MNVEANAAYPEAIAAAEKLWLETRRRNVGEADCARELAGIGLSGGGIRSATICLGVFQGLARHKLLRRVDYLSSVSGGGYFAAFLGRLFGRQSASGDTPDCGCAVEALLAESPDSRPVRNLREFGRYMAPKGGGDLLTAAAIILRNWLSIHIVLGTFALAVFVFCILFRSALERCDSLRSIPPFGGLIALLFLAWSVPCGWAYWVPPKARAGVAGPAWGLLAAVALAGVGASVWLRLHDSGIARVLACALPTAVAALTAACHWLVRGKAKPGDSFAFLQTTYRNILSRWLAASLSAMAAVLALAVLDGAGRYVWHWCAEGNGPQKLAGIGAALTAAFAGVQRVKLALQKFSVAITANGCKKLSLIAVAVGIYAVLLVGWSALAHLLANGCLIATCSRFGRCAFLGKDFTPPVTACLVWPATLLLLLVLLAMIMGAHHGFVNFSSLHTLYSARLTRAYLGASNPARDQAGTHPLTESVPGDDVSLADYWGWSLPVIGDRPCARGAPIHLINATINETVDGRSSLQQLDRKGTCIALGPCSLSVGLRHHATPCAASAPDHASRLSEAFQCVAPADDKDYKVFWTKDGTPFKPERLSLGQWVAISGAAFTTGVGSQTNLFMSMLAGFANVRLGYWWRSDIRRTPSIWKRIFWVQQQLGKEITARFPGTADREWYLSDGGHFENLGAYELLRRKLKRIVLVDAEADLDYQYGGLLQLIRKARIDFGVTIRFLDLNELNTRLETTFRPLFGTLEELRRPSGRLGVSGAHAALAAVEYPDGGTGDLLYIKSTLTGDEAPDVLDYHAKHPDFPQQTTSDQFFDEAQWESHRAVGLHIGELLFRPRQHPSDRWQPADIFA